MSETLRSSSQASTGSELVKAPMQNVVIFPDGSVVWEEPEVVEPLPYAGYELLPLKDRRTSATLRSHASARGTSPEMSPRTRWLMVAGAIALLTAGLGITLSHLSALSTADSNETPSSPLGPIEMQRYSANPVPAVLPGL